MHRWIDCDIVPSFGLGANPAVDLRLTRPIEMSFGRPRDPVDSFPMECSTIEKKERH